MNKYLLKLGVYLQDRKEQAIDWLTKAYEAQVWKFASQHDMWRKYSLGANLRRRLAHFLNERHLLTGMYVAGSLKSALFDYNSIPLSDRFEIHWKGLIFRDRLKNYLLVSDESEGKITITHREMLDKILEYSHNIAIKQKTADRRNVARWQLHPYQWEKWNDLLTKKYYKEGRHTVVAEPVTEPLILYDGTNIEETTEHLRLEGITQHLTRSIQMKGKDEEQRRIGASIELKRDKAFQYAVLSVLGAVDRKYRNNPEFFLEGLFPNQPRANAG